MSPPDAFLVSEETVTLARACRKDLPDDQLPMLDLSSRRAPNLRKGFDVDIAREAISERFFGLIGTIARREATINPDTQCVMIAHPGKKQPHLTESIQEGIALRLGLDLTSPSFPAFLQKLTEDIQKWVQRAHDTGIVQEPDGSLSLTCPNLSPVLPPLDPLEEEEKTP